MDDYAQQILERARKRKEELGLSYSSPKPLSVVNSEKSSNESCSGGGRLIASKSSSDLMSSPKTKVVRHEKENSDTNVEINITAPANVQVEVEVSECDIDSDGNIIKRSDDDLTSLSSSSSSTKAMIRDQNRSHLQRLGALYADKDISSPIHRTEQDFCEEPDSAMTTYQRRQNHRLKHLANEINSWEDDLSHPDYKHHRKTVNPNEKAPGSKKSQAPQPPIQKSKPVVSPQKPVVSPRKAVPSTSLNTQETTKNINWDPKVMNQLESQGYQRRESSTTKLVYDYNKPKVAEVKKHIEDREMPKEKAKAPKPPTSTNVRDKASLFDKRKSIFVGRDPAELSIKDRMAIFEKNKGQAPVPKVPFSQNIPASATTHHPPKPLAQILKPINVVQKSSTITEEKVLSPKKTIEEVIPETKATGMGVLSTVANLLSKEPTISESKISEEIKKQRQEEMDLLLNRYKKNNDKPVPKAPPLPPPGYLSPHDSSSLKRRSGDSLDSGTPPTNVTEESKRPRTNRLYPILSDIESASTDQDYTTASVSPSEEGEHLFQLQQYQLHQQQNQQKYQQKRHESTDEDDDSYMESEDADIDDIYNSSLGRSVLEAVKNKSARRSHNRRNSYYAAQENSYNSSMSESSNVLNELDDLLDEALDEEESESEEYMTPTKTSISSNSFRYDSKPKKNVHYQTINEEESDDASVQYTSPIKSELKVDESEDNKMVTLTHTVSFYRKQQKENMETDFSPPGRKVVKSGLTKVQSYVPSDSDDDNDEYYNENSSQVQEKIKKLLDEVCKQQTIIAQTSQALNLCASTIEFSGSTESVEGERHLLVATHRRQACLDEVQRLRVEGCLRPEGAPTDKGRLTIKDITVPLKQDYIRKLAADTISGHHLVCLLKYNENVLATKTIPTLPGLLAVKFPDVLTLNNVYADFKITMEIYGMTAQREVLPHEVKYHIAVGKKGSSKAMTPKGKNSRLVMPPVQSPAGPQAVRTPALIQYGFIIFSLKEIQRTTWSLNSVGGVSPLEGQIHMRVNCELSVSIDHRGFLTMYEDVSGFGAWHRRWCRLHGHMISYWLYPDDEKKKAPMGSIDLQNCCTQKVTTAPREVCARMNTFLLEFKRPAQDNDKESLTMYRNGKYTIIRRLLSADTKDEREEWCMHLNKAMALLRAWGNGKSERN